MAVVTTQRCARFDHPDFKITYDPALVPVAGDVRWFVGWLEETVSEGTRYSPAETIQLGWSLLQVREDEDGMLTLWEPDMIAMPINWVESVSSALSQFRTQKDVAESLRPTVELAFPSLRESAIVCTRLYQSVDLLMDRQQPTGHSSGWFFGCRGADHDHNDASQLRLVSLYEATVNFTARILPYLALPPGTLLAIQDGQPTIFLNGEALRFSAGSFLARRFGSE